MDGYIHTTAVDFVPGNDASGKVGGNGLGAASKQENRTDQGKPGDYRQGVRIFNSDREKGSEESHNRRRIRIEEDGEKHNPCSYRWKDMWNSGSATGVTSEVPPMSPHGEENRAAMGLRHNPQYDFRREEKARRSTVRLGKGWKEWLRAFFRRMGLRGRTRIMAAWGRKHYNVTQLDDQKACKELAVILMGKEWDGAFKPLAVKGRQKAVHKKMFQKRGAVKDAREKDFYSSWEWRKVRYMVLQEHGAKCMLCGATPQTGAKICVDHIKPRALYPELELDVNNLQVLCDECNMGKGRWDQTDWRERDYANR